MIYVMSDIHGHLQRFESVMSQINLQPEDTLYILGDVIDRSPDGIRILRKLMKMPNVKMLLGNHEYMMMDALVYPPDDRISKWERQWEMKQRMILWYDNGGEVTHNYLKHIRKNLRKEIFDYIESLPLNFDIEVNGQRFILVHGNMECYYELDGNNYRYDSVKEFCVWNRDAGDMDLPEGVTLIFGHTPTNHYQRDKKPMKIWHGENRYDIDCGCGYCYPGRLACLRLDDMKEFYSDYMSEQDIAEKERLDKRKIKKRDD